MATPINTLLPPMYLHLCHHCGFYLQEQSTQEITGQVGRKSFAFSLNGFVLLLANDQNLALQKWSNTEMVFELL